jgi:hypothetical protein
VQDAGLRSNGFRSSGRSAGSARCGYQRVNAPFGTKKTANGRLTVTIATAARGELDRLGAKNPVLSTNVSLRLDGRPRSDENPADPGAAVYFQLSGKATVLACDRYVDVADNIAAIAAHIDALRASNATASARSSRRSPATRRCRPTPPRTGARCSASRRTARQRSTRSTRVQGRRALKHPDVGGTDIEMAHVNRARDYAPWSWKRRPAHERGR